MKVKRIIAENVVFSNQAVRLAGTLYKPDVSMACPAMVILHAANGGTRQFPFYLHLTTRLPAQGMAVLLFDRRGSGNSGSDFETASFETLAGDGSAAVDYLRSRGDIDKERIGMYGISQGGWIAPLAAARRHDIAFLIIVSGCGVSPAKQMDYAARYTLSQAGFSEDVIVQALTLRNRVNEYYRRHTTRETVTADLDRAQNEPWFPLAYLGGSDDLPTDVTKDKWWYEFDYDPLLVWQKLQLPTLFLFAEQDRWVPLAESMSSLSLVTAHLKDVTIAQIEGTDHLMGQINGRETGNISESYIETMIAWLTKRLG